MTDLGLLSNSPTLAYYFLMLLRPAALSHFWAKLILREWSGCMQFQCQDTVQIVSPHVLFGLESTSRVTPSAGTYFA